MIIQAINLMLADADLKVLVGKNKKADTWKFYPIACPQGEIIPYVTCLLTAAVPNLCKDDSGIPEEETFDVYVWDEDYSRLDSIGRKIIGILNDGFQFVTHRDGFDSASKYMVRIITFSVTSVG